MAQYISPGVYVVERDFSDYVASLGTTSVGMVGTAKKGPVNEPTFCSTPEQFLSIFGEPDVNQYGPYAAINYLRRGNQLWYLRVARSYDLEVGLFSSYDSNTRTLTLTAADHGIGVGNFIRIREPGKRTSWSLKIESINDEEVVIDSTTTSRILETYTQGVAVIDLDVSTTGDASNNAELFAPGRYAASVYDQVKFTARHGGAWANYGSSQGIEILISDGGGFRNLDPVTGAPYEHDDGTLLEGVIPSNPSVDSPLTLLGYTSSDGVTSRQQRGVNRDFFNTEIISVVTDAGDAVFEVGDTSFFAEGDTIAITGSNINSSSSYDAVNLAVYSVVDTTTMKLAELSATTITVSDAASASAGAETTLTVSNSATLIASDIILISSADVAGLNGWHTVTAQGSGTVTIDLAWDADFDGVTANINEGTIVPYLTSVADDDTYGYMLNLDRAAPAGVYLCTAVNSTRSQWKKIGLHTKQLRVFYQGRQVEVFDNITGYDSTDTHYWDTVIGNPSNPVSDYIYAEYLGSGDTAGAQPINTYQRVKHPNNPRLLMGTSTLVKVADSSVAASVTLLNSRGVDGNNPNADAYIGTITETNTYTGIQHFRRSELYDINLLCIPGVTLSSCVAEVLDVCEDRADCLGLIDTPLGLTVQEAVDWHNGQGIYTGDHVAFVSNKAAAYYPWVKQFDPYTRNDIWLPPTAILPAVYAHSDAKGETWFAPAGITRATIPNARAVETVVSRGDMDYMYGPGNGNAVNPIAQFTRDGIVVYGQRTLQRTPSALDRINVRRLMFYIEKTIATASRRLVFEQNDPILWGQFLNLVEPFFRDLKGRRALEWYRVVCDESTNPPQKRNNNEMGAKIYVIPTKSAEKIILDFALLPSGANVEEFISADLGEG